MHWRTWILPTALMASLGLGCTDKSAETANRTGALPKNTVAVFHLTNRVATVAASEWTDGLRHQIENFYPAACLDKDSDDDGVPETFESATDESADAGDDDDELDGAGCKPCNRGPGTEGDFRLRVLAGEAVELNRGRVLALTATTFTIPSPDGDITIVTDANTRFDDGVPTPGAEVRAEGTRGPGDRVILAERLKVLCPGPTPLPADTLPDTDESDDDEADAGTVETPLP